MAILAKLGQFNATTGAVNHLLTVSGAFNFVPKIILYWWNSATTPSGNILASGLPIAGVGFGGMTNGVIRFANNYSVRNNVTTSDSEAALYNTYVMRTYYDYWDYSYLWSATTSGFRWIADSAINNPFRITYLGLGGDDLTNVWIGNFYSITTTGYINIITSGYQSSYFQPDVVMCFSTSNTTFGDVADARGSIGFATSSGNQGMVFNYDDDGLGTTNTFGLGRDNSLIQLHDSNKNLINRISFVESHPSGFILNQEVANANAYRHIYVALKGGKYKVNNIITTTGYDDIYINDGFEPKSILFLGANKPLSSGISDNFSVSIGGVSTSQAGIKSNVVSLWDEDNLDYSEAQYANYEGISASVKNNSMVGLLKYKSINPEIGFIVTPEVAYDAENFITYLSIGDTNPTKRTSKSAYIDGNTFTNHSAYVYGHDPNGLEIRAFLHGKSENYRSSKSALIRGGINTSDNTASYLDWIIPGFYSETGYFNVDTTKTAGQFITVSGLSFQPKLLLLWWTGGSIASGINMHDQDEFPFFNDNINLNTGFGTAIDSTHRFCIVGASDFSTTVMNTSRYQSNTEIMRTYTPSGGLTLDGSLDFDSFTPSGFKFEVENQFNYPFAVGYMALGGNDLTNVYIGNGTLPTATGIFNISNVGFQPDAIILTTQSQTSLPEQSDHNLLSFGWAINDNKQAVISILDKDNSTDSITKKYSSRNKIYANINPTSLTIDNSGSFIGFHPSGFILNHLSGTTGSIFNYIALKGGKYHTQMFPAGTSVGPVYTVSGVGFKPTSMIMSSVCYPSEDIIANDYEISMGFTTIEHGQSNLWRGFNQIAQNSTSINNSATADVFLCLSDLSFINADYWGLLNVLELNNDGFTFNMEDYDFGSYIYLLAMGNGGSIVSNKNAYINSSNIVIANIQSYLEGVANPVAKGYKAAYLKGSNSSLANKPCFIQSNYNFTITQVYLSYHLTLPELTSKNAYTKGGIATSTSHSCYITGEVRYTKSAFTEGYSPNVTVKSAYTNGADLKFGPDIWIS